MIRDEIPLFEYPYLFIMTALLPSDLLLYKEEIH